MSYFPPNLDNKGIQNNLLNPHPHIDARADIYIDDTLGVYFVSSKNTKYILSDNQEDIHNQVDTLIDKIKFYKYKPKDHLKEGDIEFYGVMAEQLLECIPSIVSKDKHYIPDIYRAANVRKYSDDIYILKFEIDLSDYLLTKLQNKPNIRLIDNKDKTLETTLLDVTNKAITIRCSEKIKDNKVFVYGSYDNCPSVAKDKIGELALISAKRSTIKVKELEIKNKELIDKLEEQNNKIDSLKDELYTLKKLVNTLIR